MIVTLELRFVNMMSGGGMTFKLELCFVNMMSGGGVDEWMSGGGMTFKLKKTQTQNIYLESHTILQGYNRKIKQLGQARFSLKPCELPFHSLQAGTLYY